MSPPHDPQAPPRPQPAREVLVPEGEAGRRIDNYLGSLLKGVPKPLVYRWLRRGEVRVNGGRAKPDTRVQAGDRLRLPPWHPVDSASPGPPPPGLAERLRHCTLHEGDGLLVIDKPSGIPVHGGSGLRFGVIEILRAARPDLPYLELVHRLDRATSGCLLLATDPQRLRQLNREISGPAVTKRYLALLAGAAPFEQRRVTAELARGLDEHGEGHMRVEEGGQTADTTFSVRERLPGATLVQAELGTGRTHQVRVHALSLGLPVAGDERYAEAAVNAPFAALGLRRLFLHAATLRLALPGEAPLKFAAALPQELEAVLTALRVSGAAAP
jgi:23S rRNA pseudouridine955/2504/2580 synthase